MADTPQPSTHTNPYLAIRVLLKEAEQLGMDVTSADVGEHANPGDVYDAYEATGKTPIHQHTLDGTSCGPLVAFILWKYTPADESQWIQFDPLFDRQYITGFHDGFALSLPPHVDPGKHAVAYLRGLYDGVMSNAAVF